uniref:Exosome complex component rrp45 n=1 Tax=Lygus hesperus TaxID=30085 RepID=A0A0A9XG69_LYGHE
MGANKSNTASSSGYRSSNSSSSVSASHAINGRLPKRVGHVRNTLNDDDDDGDEHEPEQGEKWMYKLGSFVIDPSSLIACTSAEINTCTCLPSIVKQPSAGASVAHNSKT